MDPRILDIVLAAGPVVAWLGVYGVVMLITRPPAIRAAPASQDLGAEPPALVSLLANGWDITVDAAESTLLDLGARRILEFRQPGDDPSHTTVHIVQNSPTGLTPYERRVFDRVAGLAIDGVVPLTALTFRDADKSKAWWKRLRVEVIADARARGLSRRRVGAPLVTTLTALAAAASIGPGYVAYECLVRAGDDDPSGGALTAGFVTLVILSALISRPAGERDTPAGREVAGQWFGVQAWLKAHPAFADLPPAAVAVWDRYLGYGAALGVTRVSSAVIDMGMGDRTRVWSSYGGTWRRVRVRYPTFGLRYGQPVPFLLIKVVITGAIGYVLAWFGKTVFDGEKGISALVFTILLVLGVSLLVHAFYQLVRTIADLVSPISRTGEVLWKQVWQTKERSENNSVPTTYYLAIDDGTADRTTAWSLPVALVDSCDTGDTVRVDVRPWTRRITAVTLEAKGRPAMRGAAGEDDSAELADEMLDGDAAAKAKRRPALSPSSLLSAEEVSQALGMPVTSQETGLPGMAAMLQFSSTDRNQPVLMLQVVDGALGRLAWRANSRGDAVPGVGDEARIRGDRALARVGDTTISVAVLGAAKGIRQGLPWLLTQAVSRYPSPAAVTSPDPVSSA